MSPSRRRSTYRPPRPRREIVTAALATAAVVVFTGVMVWVLGPHTSSSTPAIPATTTPATSATTTPSTTTTTPATTGSTSTTRPGG